MKWFNNTSQTAGLEIYNGGLRLARFSVKPERGHVIRSSSCSLPRDTLNVSFQTENIQNSEAFRQAIKVAMASCSMTKGKKVGISLPREAVKMVVLPFEDIPVKKEAAMELIKWTVTRNLPVSIRDISVSWHDMGKDDQGRQVLLVAMAAEAVLAQYRQEMVSAGVLPVTLSSTALNRYNFYADFLPGRGGCVYLDISEYFITMAGFLEEIPLFFKTVKRGFVCGRLSMRSMEKAGKCVQNETASKHNGCDNEIFLMIDHCLHGWEEISFIQGVIVSNEADRAKTTRYLQQKGVDDVIIVASEGLFRAANDEYVVLSDQETAQFAAAAGAAQIRAQGKNGVVHETH